MTASNSSETCQELVQVLSPGRQEHPKLHVDGSFIIYCKQTCDSLTKDIPLAKKFSCFFFAQKDQQKIEDFWFGGKNNSRIYKELLLEEMFLSVLKKTPIYAHASFQDITKRRKKEEKKLLWFKYNLRTFYFNELNKKTLPASKAQDILKEKLEATEELQAIIALQAIEESKDSFEAEESYPSNYPNPFLIILLRELSTLKKPKPDHTTTPFITELKGYGLFSDLDRIIPHSGLDSDE